MDEDTDIKVVTDFLMSSPSRFEWRHENGTRMLRTLQDHNPAMTRTEGVMGMLISMGAYLHGDLYEKLSPPARAMADEWNALTSSWNEGKKTILSPALGRILKTIDLFTLEDATKKPEPATEQDMIGELWDLREILHKSDKRMSYIGETNALMLDIVHGEEKQQIRDRLATLEKKLLPPTNPKNPAPQP
ncbi:MAG: hypothetical protein ACXW30_06825 [Micavibrio sp.]